MLIKIDSMIPKTFLVAIILIAAVVLALSIGILFKRAFPRQQVGNNKALKKKGIYCAKTQDTIARKNLHKPTNIHQ